MLQVSTTTNWVLPIDEIIEEATEHLGGEFTSGYDARSARRSLNLLMTDLANRDFPLAHLEERIIPLVANAKTYTFDVDVLAVLEVTFVDGTTTRELFKESIFDYTNTNFPDQQGDPAKFAFDGTTSPATLRVWPVANTNLASKHLHVWVMRRHKDITKSYQLLDLPHKYTPAIAMGLAYFLSFKKPDFDLQRRLEIKMEYEERLDRAFSMDRDRVDIAIYPSSSFF